VVLPEAAAVAEVEVAVAVADLDPGMLPAMAKVADSRAVVVAEVVVEVAVEVEEGEAAVAGVGASRGVAWPGRACIIH
jgi:hypothetical protein